MLKLIKYLKPDIDKIHLHAKYPFKLKFYLIINGREIVGNKKKKKRQMHTLIIHKQLIMSKKAYKTIFQ